VNVGECIAAGIRAMQAYIPTDAAMLMIACVGLTFFSASPAGRLARLDHRAQDEDVRSGAAQSHRSGCHADIGTVQVEPDVSLGT
jgi:hypothetical protein